MATKLTAGLVFDGSYQDVISVKRKLENIITAEGCRVIYGKTTVKPRRILLVEDGPADTGGKQIE